MVHLGRNLCLVVSLYLSSFSSNRASSAIPAPASSALFDGEKWHPIPSIDSDSVNPPPPISSSWKEATTEIYVSIVHYRDSKRCAHTLLSLFSNAKYPSRLRVGLVQQLQPKDETVLGGFGEDDCVELFCKTSSSLSSTCRYRDRIESIYMSRFESKGPGYARHLNNDMRHGEDFCLQVDSHTEFLTDWDKEMLTMWGSVDNEYAILSTQPVDKATLIEEEKKAKAKQTDKNYIVPHICQMAYTDRGMLKNKEPCAAMNLVRPLLSSAFNSGFAFGKCHAEDKVPSDPHLQQLFDGEDISKYARLWTRGYDIYSPNRNLLAHDYKPGAQDALQWANNGMSMDYKRKMYDDSALRISTLLGTPSGRMSVSGLASLTKYGLGTKRTIDEFAEFIGVDLKTERGEIQSRCRLLHWVPFKPDEDPTIDSSDIWGMAAEVHSKAAADIPLLTGPISSLSLTSHKNGKKKSKVSKDLGGLRGGLKEEADNKAYTEPIIRSGELWWFFQPLDSVIDGIESAFQRHAGATKGHRMLQISVLIFPVFTVLFLAALWILLSGQGPIVDRDVKTI